MRKCLKLRTVAGASVAVTAHIFQQSLNVFLVLARCLLLRTALRQRCNSTLLNRACIATVCLRRVVSGVTEKLSSFRRKVN